ncbi:glycosyltransferase family 4 protein [Shimia sp. MMG029]|uniref:glycosyltransferase family 4 protein n=1 Tax=Shimia sp. MMG029 TaxID=3021978 RepID=UPI0022FEBD8E|nr:glycosyltransferase family 4 protein [Shimia sp. MMG029]MDA5558144.1 glycosyltransferase family 4 protein [Shimia sp. MMG029]
MRRVVVLNDASVARGGATGLAMKQARLLCERGVQVLYVAGDRSPEHALFPDHDIDVRHVGGMALMKRGKVAAATQGLYSGAARDFVAHLIAEEDTPDTVYHVHSFSKALTPSIFSALQTVAERVFIHGHDFFLACPNGGFMDYQREQACERRPLSMGCLSTQCDKRNGAQKAWRVARQLALHRAMPRTSAWGGILMIHPAMRRFFEMAGYDAEALHTVRNPAQALTAERVPVEENDRFFFIGRVEAEKGIGDLIAAAQLAQVPLSVVGTGPLEDSLRKAHPEVTFYGWQERSEIGRALMGARALVMPSRYPEPFGLVAAEASLSGLPVVLSESALLGPEMAQKGLGFTCNPLDHSGLAATLRSVAEMPRDEIIEMSRAGASGDGALCTSPDSWMDTQLAHYDRVTKRG